MKFVVSNSSKDIVQPAFHAENLDIKSLLTSAKSKKVSTATSSFFDVLSENGITLVSFLRIWSHLLKKSLMENFVFCAVQYGRN